MIDISPDRLRIRFAILAKVTEAVENGVVLHSGGTAEQLATLYPHCGLTVQEIEDEIIRQVGLAHGAAEIGHGSPLFPPTE